MCRRSRCIYILALTMFLQAVALSLECKRGSKVYTPGLGGPDVCVDCQDGQFMPEEHHTFRRCYTCTDVVNPTLEVLVSPCSPTHDTGIHCIEGYYRTQPHYPKDRGRCEKCTDCPFPKLPCQKQRDTVCCPDNDYGVYVNEVGHTVCVRECGPGEFFNSAVRQCLPCPQNSYMDEVNHINTYCKSCKIPVSNKEKIVQSCNKTHPTVIDCVEGYHRWTSDIKQTAHNECLRSCGRGQYLDSKTDSCQKCPQDTYMDEDRHRHCDRCKSCQSLKSPNEIILQPCNSTHQSVVACKDGFYRRLSVSLLTQQCVPCQNCAKNTDGNIYEGLACGGRNNTLCCPHPDMVVVEPPSGPQCVMSTIPKDSLRRGAGKYLSTIADTKSVTGQALSDDDYSLATTSGLASTVAVLLLSVIAFFVIKCKRRPHRSKARQGEKTLSHTNSGVQTKGDTDDNGGPNQFISIDDLGTSNIPVRYHHPIIIKKLVKLQAALTVLVKVDVISPLRPGDLPCKNPVQSGNYSYIEKKRSYTGSGWVESARLYKDRPCPCETCQQESTEPVKSWSEIIICTAASVVFDTTEGEKCRCYFDYDRDDNDPRLCPSISKPMKVLSDTENDWCFMTFVIHDVELGEQIQEKLLHYQKKRSYVKQLYGVSTTKNMCQDLPLVVIVSHPNGGFKKVSIGSVKNCPVNPHGKYSYTNVTDTGCEGARVFILGDTRSRDYGHSQRVDELSLSGAWSDTPGIDDLSVANPIKKKHV